MSQNQRDIVMKQFRNRQIQMLVATDVAARGIDVHNITHVINYQLPDEIETYTHRSGRTGRAGNQGISIVIVTKSEVRKIKSIEKKIQKTFEKKELLIEEGSIKTEMFFIREGLVRCYIINEKGDEITFGLIAENQILANADVVLYEQKSRFYYEALEKTKAHLKK